MFRINGGDSNQGDLIADTSVQEKNITFPTDAKLHRKIIGKCKLIARWEDVDLRQSYTRTLKQLGVAQRFRNHRLNRTKAFRADRKVRTIAGRLVRELDRKLPAYSQHRNDLALFARVLSQKRGDKHKIYSLHSRRAAIEPVIGHLKSDHRLSRNFYKGITGDNINVMLAAAAYNFKRMMNRWRNTCIRFWFQLFDWGGLLRGDYLTVHFRLLDRANV